MNYKSTPLQKPTKAKKKNSLITNIKNGFALNKTSKSKSNSSEFKVPGLKSSAKKPTFDGSKRRSQSKKSIKEKLSSLDSSGSLSRSTPKYSKDQFRRKHKKNVRFALGISTFLVILLLLIPILNITFRLINDPAKKAVKATSQQKDVIGFIGIPPYPDSEYVFESNKDAPEVKDFLTSGRSVYRMPVGSDFEDVLEFYKEKLKADGWTHNRSVPIESEENMPGEYFIKGEEGLRIHSQLNDIWYQKLTLEEAKTALAQDVKDSKERELVLSTLSGSELLPNISWELKVPPEYLVRYYDVEVNKSLRAIRFQKLNSIEVVLLEPLFEQDGRDPKTMTDEYIKNYNDKIDEKVKNETDDKERDSLLDEKLVNNNVQFLYNSRENYYYILVSNIRDNPFIDYVATTITVKDKNLRPLNTDQ